MTTRVCDLPQKLIGEQILSRIPITSLRAVRSTCKSWDALTKRWVLGKAAAATQQFLGFMIMGSKVCSLRFHLCLKDTDKDGEEDLVDLSIKQVGLLNDVEIYNVFHCDGLLLCVATENSKLVVWNPYLGQTRWIRPRTRFHRLDTYAIGYDINRNHKILRFVDHYHTDEAHLFEFDIYELSSNTWRVFDARPDWEVENHQPGVSVKGNAYFFAHEKLGRDFFAPVEIGSGEWEDEEIEEIEDFLLCFDFTTERFGPRLPLPFHSYSEDTVTLSCVREEQLAVLYQKEGRNDNLSDIVEIWVTTTIEPDSVSWSKFLKVAMRPFALTGVRFDTYFGGSFFIDEEEKVAVVFDLDGYLPTIGRARPPRYYTAYIIGEDGYFKPVRLGEALGFGKPNYIPKVHRVCSSSYLPSLVQVNQLRKRKERDVQTCFLHLSDC